MSSPDQLRSYAVDCARLARSASDPHDKARLLNMARAWIEMADRIEKIGQTRGEPASADVSPPAPGSDPPGCGEP